MVENETIDGCPSKRGVVGDFGLATKIPDPSREFQLSIVGSPYWMAPECIKSQPYNEIVSVVCICMYGYHCKGMEFSD